MIQIYFGSNEIEIDGQMTGLGYAVDAEGAYVYPRHGEYRKIRLSKRNYALAFSGDEPNSDKALLEKEVRMIVEALHRIAELQDDGYDLEQIADFLCDGEALANAGYTDADKELVETMHGIVEDMRK